MSFRDSLLKIDRSNRIRMAYAIIVMGIGAAFFVYDIPCDLSLDRVFWFAVTFIGGLVLVSMCNFIGIEAVCKKIKEIESKLEDES